MFLSMKEPKSVKYSLEDVDWYNAMEEEIEQIEKNKTLTLVPTLEEKKCDWHQVGIKKQAR